LKHSTRYILALMQMQGVGGEVDLKSAFNHLKELGKAEYLPAQLLLGLHLELGRYVKRDLVLAWKYLSNASKTGDEEALMAVARLLELGEGPTKRNDYENAFRIYYLLHQRGYSPATHQMARYEFFGLRGKANLEKGKQFLETNVKKEYLPSMLMLAVFYRDGVYPDPGLKKSKLLLMKAMGKKHWRAGYELAQLYMKEAKGDISSAKKAILTLYKLSENGYAPASWWISQMYNRGHLLPMSRTKAFMWQKTAMAQLGLDYQMMDWGRGIGASYKTYKTNPGTAVHEEMYHKSGGTANERLVSNAHSFIERIDHDASFTREMPGGDMLYAGPSRKEILDQVPPSKGEVRQERDEREDPEGSSSRIAMLYDGPSEGDRFYSESRGREENSSFLSKEERESGSNNSLSMTEMSSDEPHGDKRELSKIRVEKPPVEHSQDLFREEFWKHHAFLRSIMKMEKKHRLMAYLKRLDLLKLLRAKGDQKDLLKMTLKSLNQDLIWELGKLESELEKGVGYHVDEDYSDPKPFDELLDLWNQESSQALVHQMLDIQKTLAQLAKVNLEELGNAVDLSALQYLCDPVSLLGVFHDPQHQLQRASQLHEARDFAPMILQKSCESLRPMLSSLHSGKSGKGY